MSKKKIWLIIGIVLSALVTLSPLWLAGCLACITSDVRMDQTIRYEEAMKNQEIIAPYDDSVIIKTYEETITEINSGN